MRHGKKINHLGRTDSHRKAMLSNMASSLILHKRITTTLAKAKALRTYVEPLITKSKSDTTHSRRTVFSYLKDKDTTAMLFREIAEKVASRPGGYTRIIKLENRAGDNAEMAIIELVDYNTVYTKDAAVQAKKATRRRGGAGKGKAATPVAPAVVEASPTSVNDQLAAGTEEAEAELPAAPVTDEAFPTAVNSQITDSAAPEAEAETPVAPAPEAPEAPAQNEENAEKGE